MKVAIVLGSARKGNTYAAVKAFAEGASAKNEVEIIEADRLNLSGCKGCGACECYKGCIAQDDTNVTVDKLVSADVILFTTPVYWWGMTAQLKLVIDKCYCKARYLKEKKVGVIVPGGSPAGAEQYELIRRQFECMARYLKWDLLFFKDYYAYGLNDLAQNAEVQAELKTLGENI